MIIISANPSFITSGDGEKFFPSNDSNRSFEAVEVWAERGGYGSSYAAKVAQLSFSEPAPGVMKLFSLDQNFTDSNVVSNSIPLQILGSAEQATSRSNNNGEYQMVRVLNFDNNYTVGYVTHQVYPGYSQAPKKWRQKSSISMRMQPSKIRLSSFSIKEAKLEIFKAYKSKYSKGSQWYQGVDFRLRGRS